MFYPFPTDAHNVMDGGQYKGLVLGAVLAARWRPRTVVHLAAMFKDLAMTSDQLHAALCKITEYEAFVCDYACFSWVNVDVFVASLRMWMLRSCPLLCTNCCFLPQRFG